MNARLRRAVASMVEVVVRPPKGSRNMDVIVRRVTAITGGRLTYVDGRGVETENVRYLGAAPEVGKPVAVLVRTPIKVVLGQVADE